MNREQWEYLRRQSGKENKMKKYLIPLLLFVLAACTGSSSELSSNRSTWQDADIEHYRFELGVGCFCPVGGLMPLTVEVQDGEVVSAVDVNGNQFDATNPMNEFVMQYATIDRIFEKLSSKDVQAADKLTVSYDPVYGFPTDVQIDFIELAADDELYLSIAAFEPLP